MRVPHVPSFVLLGFLLTAGCGGGGGEDVCNDSVACIQPDPALTIDSTALVGTYDVPYALQSNSCEGASPLPQLRERYEVTTGFGYHGIPTIDVASNTGVIYYDFSSVGNTDGATYFDAFQVGQQELTNFRPGLDCVETLSLAFREVGQSKASVVRTSEIDCAEPGVTIVQGGTGHCQVVYAGIASVAPKP